MGILTSDGGGKTNKLMKVLTHHNGKLSIFCYISGVIIFGYLITDSDRTYFSDNALLTGLVQREFTLLNLAKESLISLNNEAKVNGDRIPYQWIMNEFRQNGLEVYTHNFTLNYPFGSKPKYKGENVYAILRTSRAPSTEAIILSSPYRTDDNPHGSTLPGIALMIAVSKYFSSRTYWAKDVIFLISDHELVGIQSWLNAYHDSDKLSSVLDHGFLESRSGPIQAAVNLEIHSDQISNIDIKIEGLNGQLPNLDLFNVAVELCTRESITPTFHGASHPMESDRFKEWKYYASTIGSMMISQGITLPSGAHGLFQRFSIQAITLEGSDANLSKNPQIGVSLLQIGRLIEGIFRSLNNLLEKFNRSYYFYLLTSTRRYISIGYYMIPFGIVTVPLILKALELYFSADDSESSGLDTLWNSLPFCFTCHLFGLFLVMVPHFIDKFSFLTLNYPSHDLIYYTLLTLTVMFMLNPLMRVRPSNQNSRICITLLNLSLLLCSLSLINISLAFALSIVYVPIARISRKYTKRIFRLFNAFLVILLHPLVIGYLCLFIMSLWYDTKTSIITHLIRSFEAQRKVVLYYIEDWYIYGNWTYMFGCAVLFPLWLQMWYNV